MHIARNYVIHSSGTPHTYVRVEDRQLRRHTQKAKRLICKCAMISDELFVLLTVHTLRIERKPLLILSSIESSSRSEEGCGGQEMTPELLNKAFSAKATLQIWKTT